LRFVVAFALSYPKIQYYTLFNEPFSTLLFSGGVGAWPPYFNDSKGMISLWNNVLPSWIEASRMYKDMLPNARHVHVDSVERHSGPGTSTQLSNDRRFAILDLMLGVDLDPDRPFFVEMVEAGGEQLLEMEPGNVDVLGLDYYAHNQWYWPADNQGVAPSPEPAPLSQLIQEYWQRYRLPCLLGETNVRGTTTDRATWFKYTLEQCELAQAAGVPMEGHCWFPFIDSCDWDSLLRRIEGNIDPVGIYYIDDDRKRYPSEISYAFTQASKGVRSADLPAYHFQAPLDSWLSGWIAHMSHWEWRESMVDLRATNDPDHVEFDPLGALNVVVR
jgi:beta-glucosidase/6-phospho-beta-glucosidase/beta-galactosidase